MGNEEKNKKINIGDNFFMGMALCLLALYMGANIGNYIKEFFQGENQHNNLYLNEKVSFIPKTKLFVSEKIEYSLQKSEIDM